MKCHEIRGNSTSNLSELISVSDDNNDDDYDDDDDKKSKFLIKFLFIENRMPK